MNYSKLDQKAKDAINYDARFRTSQMVDLLVGYFQEAIKGLLLVNTSGLIAILTLAGTKIIEYKKLIDIGAVFSVGAFFAIVTLAILIINLMRNIQNLDKQVGKFYEDKINYKELNDRITDKNISDKYILLLPLISFLCFISGSIWLYFVIK
jgi:hypothetical protein